jgi:hypothetical protein
VLLSRTNRLLPLELTMGMKGFARSGYQPPPEFMRQVAQLAMQKLHQFSPLEYSQLLWAYAALGYRDVALFETIVGHTIHALQTWTRRLPKTTVDTIIWSCERVGFWPQSLVDTAEMRGLYVKTSARSSTVEMELISGLPQQMDGSSDEEDGSSSRSGSLNGFADQLGALVAGAMLSDGEESDAEQQQQHLRQQQRTEALAAAAASGNNHQQAAAAVAGAAAAAAAAAAVQSQPFQPGTPQAVLQQQQHGLHQQQPSNGHQQRQQPMQLAQQQMHKQQHIGSSSSNLPQQQQQQQLVRLPLLQPPRRMPQQQQRLPGVTEPAAAPDVLHNRPLAVIPPVGSSNSSFSSPGSSNGRHGTHQVNGHTPSLQHMQQQQ